MNKLKNVFIVLPVIAAGCATPPAATTEEALPVTVEVPAKRAAPTTIDADPVDDDFWGTGTRVEVDEDGRLLYASRIELIEGRGMNSAHRVPRDQYHPNAVYVDPLTGRKVVLNHGPSAWRRVPRAVVAPPSQPSVSNAPVMSNPRPASSRMDGPSLRRGPDRGLRRER